MASIHLARNAHRAVIRRKDFYVSKNFRDRAAAEEWANAVEKKYLAAKERREILSADRLVEDSVSRAKVALLEADEAMKMRESRKMSTLPQLADIRASANQAAFSGIYFLLQGDTVVYVGKSKSVYSRLGDHLVNNDLEFDRFSILPCPLDLLRAVEWHYIGRFNPKYNKKSPIEVDLPGGGTLRLTGA